MKFNFLLFILIIQTGLFSSCAQLGVFHTARTEGAGKMTLSPTLEGIGTSQAAGGSEYGTFVLPYFQLELAYGMTDNLDLVLSGSTAANLMGSLKYRIVGSNDSGFALSIMPGYEYQSSFQNNGGRADRLHIPIIASVYTSENIGLFVAPKYTLQVAEGIENFSFPGISFGLSYERRIKYIFGGGFHIPFTTQVGVQGYLSHFGVSARVPLN